MLKWLMHRGTAAFERQWNYDASYVHELIDADPRAAWMFQRAAALGKYRNDVPADALAAAAITAVRHEDCGPCTQLGVQMAERSGVDPRVLRAVLTDTPLMMPPDVALAWRFTRATLDHDPAADEYRDAGPAVQGLHPDQLERGAQCGTRHRVVLVPAVGPGEDHGDPGGLDQ